MAFLTDEQTLNDLAIFGKSGRASVYDLFKATTRGGALLLQEMFRHPFSDEKEINKRSSIIRFLLENEVQFPFKKEWFEDIGYYLDKRDRRVTWAMEEDLLRGKWRKNRNGDREYGLLCRGLFAGIGIVNAAAEFLQWMAGKQIPEAYEEECRQMSEIVQDPNLAWALQEKKTKRVPRNKMGDYDRMFRFDGKESLKKLLHHVYRIDVYVAAAEVARKRGFVFGKALPPGENVLRIEGMYHPLLENAVPNMLNIDGNRNVVFLTGANMAGKSTFMKTFAVSVFLAHMGFPLPVKRMEFSVRNGIYTTINLPDSLNMGYSHFYAEVLRVRKVAERVCHSDNLVIVFDELFRGTNVKDAYDATVAVMEAFAVRKSSVFMVSTHLIEAGEELRGRCDNIDFVYLPTEMRESVPVYSYRLKQGITDDRYGMTIVHNAGITDLLKARDGERTRRDRGFAVDKQTLSDLNLLGKFKENSIFNLFNRTSTRGGEQFLEYLFEHPLTDAERINKRGGVFEFFREKNAVFPFTKELLGRVERYLGMKGYANRWVVRLNTYCLKLVRHAAKEKVYEMICSGLADAIELLNACYDFNTLLSEEGANSAYADVINETFEILDNERLRPIRGERGERKFSVAKVARYDYVLRHLCRKELGRLLEMIYHADVYVAVADVAREKGFVRAVAHAGEEGKNVIDITGVYHPQLPGSVGNSLRIDDKHNVLFLTGANMAGKSTLMKSFGVAVYLAHMGFPVAAKAMAFAVSDGLYTSINVSDHMELGYSHFYAEVLRAKHVAEEVHAGKNLVIVLDELFKGTNVKDAYDATVAVTKAFGENKNCSYLISTHITEAGLTLQEACQNFKFVYLPTMMIGTVPVYSYRLEEGITCDRFGMMIVHKERIVDIIRENST